jgi:hypothetical protein
MSSGPGQWTMLLSFFVSQLPVLLVCVIAIGLMLTRRQQDSPALPWALTGFGLALLICIGQPIGSWILQQWIMSGGATAASRATIWSVVSIIWSILHALSYGLLAMAILASQSRRESGSSASVSSRP